MKEVKITFVVSWLIVFTLFSGQVLAAKLNILTENLAPYQIVSKDSIKGLSTEIVEAALKESQYSYDITAYPWALSFNRAKHEKNTCIYSLVRTPQRESLFKWIGHIASSSVSLYSIKNSKVAVSNIEEAKKYNIAVIRDDIAHQFLLTKGFKENKNLYVANSSDALLKLLDLPSRRIDLILLNDDLLKNRVEKVSDISRYENVYQFKELTLNFHLACSLNTEQKIVNNLVKAMKVLEKRGVFEGIRNKWKKDLVNLINK